MSEPMVFCRDIECSGVNSLEAVKSGADEKIDVLLTWGFHHADLESVRPLR